MKILLLGANGQLGRSFMEDGGLAARGELVPATRDGVLWNGERGEIGDLSASLGPLLDRVRPDVIVNTAAYTAVDRAEQDETLATRINGEAVGELGAWAAAHGALVVHYSTDYVFDGMATTPYPVEAPTGPLGAYGRSKLAGEEALRASGADHLILRTAWVYAPHGHNFLRTMLRLGTEREELRVVADQQGSPTSAAMIVRASLAALDRGLAEARTAPRGTYHLVAGGHVSWYGFATAIFEDAHSLGLIARVPKVVPVPSVEYPTLARRPAWSVMETTKFSADFNVMLPQWRTELKNVIRQLGTQVKP
jgi:dTDP-4-dehydrorhamnose reductase